MAVGMAQIFSAIPGMKHLTAFWYHFMIMFEALFILTTIDAGSRVLRYIVQELLGRKYKRLGDHGWWPGVIAISAISSVLWGWLLYHGDIQTIWPMFGVANQLLAAVALAIGTVVILTESPRPIYALTTAIPFVFLIVTTAYAGILNIVSTYWPMTRNSATAVSAWANVTLTVVMLLLVGALTVETVRKILLLVHTRVQAPRPATT